ncbi:ypt/Rab-type GTPase ypt7-like [Rhincodon typus]|uniref:ypt/Rab-type GTPase ypt7-like n=1 Tax=Rhincodon typus TaxID=259920 RepID=UPI00202FCE51|nr:ypt/Rab-type GTPase ypt7-like [Rhincodon typus]
MANDYLFKVLVIGDCTVGKTSLVQRYANDSFSKNYKSTVGAGKMRGREALIEVEQNIDPIKTNYFVFSYKGHDSPTGIYFVFKTCLIQLKEAGDWK